MRQYISPKLRFAVFHRDRFTCQYCGDAPPHCALECDHIIPVASGGLGTQDNLITACSRCNAGKSDIHLPEHPEAMKEDAKDAVTALIFAWTILSEKFGTDALNMLEIASLYAMSKSSAWSVVEFAKAAGSIDEMVGWMKAALPDEFRLALSERLTIQ